jgi:hypothetical protein
MQTSVRGEGEPELSLKSSEESVSEKSERRRSRSAGDFFEIPRKREKDEKEIKKKDKRSRSKHRKNKKSKEDRTSKKGDEKHGEKQVSLATEAEVYPNIISKDQKLPSTSVPESSVDVDK